jgi:hypothetical protein
VDKVKIIDLKTYFTQPSLYLSQSRKFWIENQTAILEFVGALEDKGSFLNMHSFMARIDTAASNPRIPGSREAYLILGNPLDISAHDYGDAELQKLVTDEVLAAVDRELRFVVVTVPKADDNAQGSFYSEHKREHSDPWSYISNDMLAHLLSYFSLTQIHPFQHHGQRVQVPSGLELVQLIQSRLMPPDYRGGQPFAAFNQFFDPRFSGGFRPFPRCWNGGNTAFNSMNSMFAHLNAPQVSNGYYARHPYKGAWTWYPSTPVFVVLNVDRTDDNPQATLGQLLHQIFENMGTYGLVGERHIPDMVQEIKATLENHPRALSLLLNDQVTLFVGDSESIQPYMRKHTDNYYTNWLLSDGAWNPLEEYKPINVIQCIEGVAKYIPGYMDERFGGMPPHMY